MKFIAALFPVLFLVPVVNAQTVIMTNGNSSLNSLRAASAPGANQTISINFQLSVPAKPGTAESDLTKYMSEASQTLYDIVNHECAILSASLKGNCRLVQMNIGGNINNRGNANTPTFATVNASYEITPVPEPSAPAGK